MGADKLAPHEGLILELIAHGYTYAGIAARLGVSASSIRDWAEARDTEGSI